MRVGVTLEDERGLDGNVSSHFGQCAYFLIADVADKKIENARVVPNTAQHGGGGCVAVDEILKQDITHVIAGGMGAGAQNKFALANVEVFGYSGNVKEAMVSLINDSLGGLDACREHGDHH